MGDEVGDFSPSRSLSAVSIMLVAHCSLLTAHYEGGGGMDGWSKSHHVMLKHATVSFFFFIKKK